MVEPLAPVTTLRPRVQAGKPAPDLAARVQLLLPQTPGAKLKASSHFYDLMARMQSERVSFVTVLGPRSTGKSFLVDKLLELNQMGWGNSFSRGGPTKGCWVSECPCSWTQRSNKFLVDCEGAGAGDCQDRLLFLYLVSTVVVLKLGMADCEDEYVRQFNLLSEKVRARGEHLSVSKPTLLVVGGRPEESPSLKRVSGETAAFQQVLRLGLAAPFAVEDLTNESLLNFPLGAMTTQFRSGLEAINGVIASAGPKCLSEVPLNAKLVTILVESLLRQVNSRHEACLRQLWESIVEEAMISNYNYALLTYSDYLKDRLHDDRVYEEEELDQHLHGALVATLENYMSEGIPADCKPIYDKYREKLTSFVAVKQRQIKQVNGRRLGQAQLQRLQTLSLQLQSQPSPGKQAYRSLLQQAVSPQSWYIIESALQSSFEQRPLSNPVSHLKSQALLTLAQPKDYQPKLVELERENEELRERLQLQVLQQKEMALRLAEEKGFREESRAKEAQLREELKTARAEIGRLSILIEQAVQTQAKSKPVPANSDQEKKQLQRKSQQLARENEKLGQELKEVRGRLGAAEKELSGKKEKGCC